MAKSKNPRTPTRSGARSKGKDAGFEVQDQGQDPGQADGSANATPAGPSAEQMIVLVTFVALLAALILSQVELGSSYGRGLFG